MKEVEQGTSGKMRGQIFTRENHSCPSRKKRSTALSQTGNRFAFSPGD